MVLNGFPNGPVIPPRVPSNMGDPDIHILAEETKVFREPLSDHCSVNVPIYCTKGMPVFEDVTYFRVADITRVPYLIATGEKSFQRRIKKAMCVRYETYMLHCLLPVK